MTGTTVCPTCHGQYEDTGTIGTNLGQLGHLSQRQGEADWDKRDTLLRECPKCPSNDVQLPIFGVKDMGNFFQGV